MKKVEKNMFEELPNFKKFYSDEDLEGFLETVTKKLEVTKKKLLRSLEKLKNTESQASGNTSSNAQSSAEQGTDAMEREKAFLFAQRDEKYLLQLRTSLEQIKAKTYGICRSCGIQIKPIRLHAVPTTTICFHCKSKKDKSNI